MARLPPSPDSVMSQEDEGAAAVPTAVPEVPYVESAVPMGPPSDHILNLISVSSYSYLPFLRLPSCLAHIFKFCLRTVIGGMHAFTAALDTAAMHNKWPAVVQSVASQKPAVATHVVRWQALLGRREDKKNRKMVEFVSSS
jgi:hypothetical protein